MRLSNLQTKRWLAVASFVLGYGIMQCFSVPTTNSIPSNLFLTDNGFLFWYGPSGEKVVHIKDIWDAEKNPESRPAAQFPEGNWGKPSNGFQLSLRFENKVYTNGEPMMATTLMRNVTNTQLTYYFPIQIMAMKDSTILKRKGDLGIHQITTPPTKVVFPQTQIKFRENVINDYDLDGSGTYVFQAVCHHPEVSSKEVTILITNNIVN